MSKKSELAKVALGVSLGVGAGILLAPKSGKETRRELKEKMAELLEGVKSLKDKGIKNEFEKKIKELEKEINNLDKEKVLHIAKEKAKKIKEKADNLVETIKEKGDAALEKIANDLRKQATEVCTSVLERLENTK